MPSETFDSLTAKITRKGYKNLDEIRDSAGIRPICLFKSDLSKIDKIIYDSFEVIEKQDKLGLSDDPLAYNSVHYVCRFPDKFKGPRYRKIQGMVFEIQVRTLCMHAWAAVSHYLDYKSGADVPSELKMGLRALAGLFYVADEQYENLYGRKIESQSIYAEMDLKNLDNVEINLDTLNEYVQKKFPKRIHTDLQSISEFLGNITAFGYEFIGALDKDIEEGIPEVLKRERQLATEMGESLPKYYTLAMARIALQQANPEFEQYESSLGRNRRERVTKSKS